MEKGLSNKGLKNEEKSEKEIIFGKRDNQKIIIEGKNIDLRNQNERKIKEMGVLKI